MRPEDSQFDEHMSSAPEWFARPITHEDMLAEAAARQEEKDFPKIEVDSKVDSYLKDATKKGNPPF